MCDKEKANKLEMDLHEEVQEYCNRQDHCEL